MVHNKAPFGEDQNHYCSEAAPLEGLPLIHMDGASMTSPIKINYPIVDKIYEDT